MKRTSWPTIRTAALGVGGAAALFFAVAAALLFPASASANQCQYSDGTSNNGPCVEVRNELGPARGIEWGTREMNLWCQQGPTPSNHKIILRNWYSPDSFTCRGVAGQRTHLVVQRAQARCNKCDERITCEGKVVLTLYDRHGGGENISQSDCVQ